MTAAEKLQLAQRHLAKVESALSGPADDVDWDDLSLYGFYCLEAAVEAAGLHFGYPAAKKHYEKANVAGILSKNHGLPEAYDLLRDLNEARKASGYGDVRMPELNPEAVIGRISAYVKAVKAAIES